MGIDAIVIISPATTLGRPRLSVSVHNVFDEKLHLRKSEWRTRIACGESA